MKTKIVALGLAVVIAAVVNANTQITTVKTNEEIVSWVSDYMDNAVMFDHFSGVVLISRDGRPIFRKAYGSSNYELDVPNRVDTKFRIGSVSKQFTAVAIMQLQEKGKLRIDDAICQYLDDCPDTWTTITVKNLLNHTSGLVNFTRLPAASGNFLLVPHSRKEIVDTFRQLPLESKPGEEYNYNNSGYYLLGLIVEKVSGTDYADYLRQNIFKPLGMDNTDSDNNTAVVKNRAASYSLGRDFIFQNANYTNMNILFSIGGAYSTVDDLLLWERAFESKKLLKRSTIQEVFTPGKGGYGYGWWIDNLGSCARNYHDGGVTNFSASIQRLAEDQLSIIAISNRGDDGGLRAAYDIVGKVCGVPATIRGIQPELMTLNAEKLVELVESARSKFPIFDIGEAKVEEMGNYLMLQKRAKQAIEVFKVNVSLYPKSAKAYLKLALAYESVADKPQAIVNFRKCIEIDPANKLALDRLQLLTK